MAGSVFLKLLSQIMLMVPEKIMRVIKRKADREIEKYQNYKGSYSYWSFNSPGGLRFWLKSQVMESFIEIKFENLLVSVTKMYDYMLKEDFGDYMELPPENERGCKHNPDIIEFNIK